MTDEVGLCQAHRKKKQQEKKLRKKLIEETVCLCVRVFVCFLSVCLSVWLLSIFCLCAYLRHVTKRKDKTSKLSQKYCMLKTSLIKVNRLINGLRMKKEFQVKWKMKNCCQIRLDLCENIGKWEAVNHFQLRYKSPNFSNYFLKNKHNLAKKNSFYNCELSHKKFNNLLCLTTKYI
jgi:hypothetical protein